ncbi:putative oxidoreductase [Lamellibrachia satsuma]|nr:putative oxidoreductase [Lamellibrachia satsuma]
MLEDRQVVLVTGASGYIGLHIVHQLLRDGIYHVRGTVGTRRYSMRLETLKSMKTHSNCDLDILEADLIDPPAWIHAVRGCTYVIHTASPFPAIDPKNEDELLEPVVEGTLNVLRACSVTPCVQRVVITSSILAMSGLEMVPTNKVLTEKDWPQADHLSVYAKSKTIAEQKAWEFLESLRSDQQFELAVINPSFVLGPVLSGELFSASKLVPKWFLEKRIPMIPHVNLPVVDVRDVAAAHISAMTAPDAYNHRHILHATNIWCEDIGKILSGEFSKHGYKVPTRSAPYSFVWLASLFNKTLRPLLPIYGKETKVDNTRMRTVLGVEPRDIRTTIIDMGYSMIEMGLIKKKPKYSGRGDVAA